MEKSNMKRIADKIVSSGVRHSENGHQRISFDEIYNRFGLGKNDANGNLEELEKELRQRDEITDLIMTEDCIEISYHLEYCEECRENPLSALSVIGCNLYDEHFGTNDCDEECEDVQSDSQTM